jgi:tape measure domain-containing protein
LAGVFALSAIKSFSAEVLKTTIEFDTLRKAINFTSGSMEVGAANFTFLKRVAEQLGLSLEAASSGFKKISGSAAQAGYTNKQVQVIFENTSKAVAAFGLSSEQSSGVFEALSQIISKGVVSMEELRQQLGERLPGVFAIAAKSVGKTTEEFIKLVSSGKVTQEEFIVPFTNALGLMAEKASGIDSAGKAVTRFKNAYDSLLISLGRSADEEVGVIGFITKRASNLFNYWAKTFETDLQKVENAAGEGYQSVIDGVIKDLPAAEQESVRLRIVEQKKLTEEKKKQLQAQLKDEKDRYDKLSAFQKLAEGGLVTFYEDQIQLQNIKLAQFDGELKALNEIKKTDDIVKAVTKKTQEELKKEYDARLKLLELERRIAEIRIKLATEEGGDRDIKILKNTKDFGEKELAIKREYAGKGLTEAKEASRLQVLVVREQTDAIIVEIKKQAQEGANLTKAAKEQIEKQLQDNDDFEDKKEARRQQSIRDEADYQKELVKLNKERGDAILAIDKKSAREKKELETDLKEITKQENEAYAYAAGQFADLITQRRLDNFNREYNALQRNYQEELRLAGGNVQKIAELDEKRLAKERELRTKEFKAQQLNSIAQVIFKTAPIIAGYSATIGLQPAAIAALAVAAAQIAYIAAQPVPEFAEGTKGKPFKGGKAIVGEIGKEWVVTTSGQVYETPGVATLVDLPKGSQVIPNKDVMKAERFMGSKMMSQSRGDSGNGHIVSELISIKETLSKLPITSLTMDERGFTKKIQTKTRETKILNNRFGN